MKTLTVVARGNTEVELQYALLEILKQLGKGFTSGFDANDEGNYHFHIVEDPATAVVEPLPPLALPARTWYWLQRAGIHTTEDILKHSAADLKELDGIGVSSVLQIKLALEDINITSWS